MKIYPGKHQIVQTQEVMPNIDIPLAYIDSVTSNYKVSIIPKIRSNGLLEVIPYSVFGSQDVCLFDETKTIVDNTSILQRNNQDTYTYIPKDAVSFMPERFSYVVTGKKKINYTSQKNYNIRVGCIDSLPDLTFAKKLIKVFGDAPKRNVSPTNISVNNMDLSIESLTNSTIQENDFVFIESSDGNNYQTGMAIDIDNFLNNHSNVWLSVDDYSNFPIYTLASSTEFRILLPKILNSISYSTTKAFPLVYYVDQNYIVHNIFNNESSPILILESPKKGFIVVSPKEFLNNIETNVNLFYEVMMYVFSNTYTSIQGPNEWITDKLPDYVILNNKLTKKDNFTSQMSLAKMSGLSQNEISLVDIAIKNDDGEPIDYIRYIGITNDYIIFDKTPTENHADPEKPEGYISVFTPRQDIIYFKSMLYLIEDNIQEKVSYSNEGSNLTFIISPFRSSVNNINISTPTVIIVPLTTIIDYKEKAMDHLDLYLCCKNNILSIKDVSSYGVNDGVIIAEVKVTLESQNKANILDMRQRGGGLSESEDPNYELFDIGNVFGRPYRATGTMIITLPKRLESYEELILKAIKKHMLAEDLPIVLFE